SLFHSSVGLGSAPDILVEAHQDGGIRVACQSSGWYPQPKGLWRDHQGHLLPLASENISQAANGLFQTEIATVLTEESNQKVSCHVWNPRLAQEKELAIFIAELFFPRANPWKVALAVILPLLAVLLPLASYCFWRQHGVKGEVRNVHFFSKHKNKELTKSKKRWWHTLDVTLDPDTANPYLILSADWKHVVHRDENQGLPDTLERFDKMAIVLGTERFLTGRHYWEVEVGHKKVWTLGVCRETVRRKGHLVFIPPNGFWTICHLDGRYTANTSNPLPFPVSTRPSRVGIFLDYEAGEVLFYNVTDRFHLFTFTNTFSGTLRPYFNPEYNIGGTNMDPLIICPV
uniref:B30.2/SPRY domain-containing protein n=1 Tax=Pelodiscus sinensis TaxID=13735 RepID=K7FSZ0_PELSI